MLPWIMVLEKFLKFGFFKSNLVLILAENSSISNAIIAMASYVPKCCE